MTNFRTPTKDELDKIIILMVEGAKHDNNTVASMFLENHIVEATELASDEVIEEYITAKNNWQYLIDTTDINKPYLLLIGSYDLANDVCIIESNRELTLYKDTEMDYEFDYKLK